MAQISGIGEHKAGTMAEIVELRKQIATLELELQRLEKKMRKESQLDVQIQINRLVKAKRLEIAVLREKLEGLGV